MIILCNCRSNSFLFCTIIKFYLLISGVYILKMIIPMKNKNFKEKDILLISPFLTYLGQTLFFFFEKNNASYEERNHSKLNKNDYIYIGIICLLLLIIDFYKIFAIILNKINFLLKFILLVKSWIYLLIFSILLSIFLFKIKIYIHHKIVICYYLIIEILSLILVFWKGEIYKPILWISLIGISFAESIIYILIKNLMEIKLFSPFKVCYLIGSINSIISLIILIILSFIKCNPEFGFCTTNEYFSFYSFLIENNKKTIIYVIIMILFISLISGINKYLINSVLNKYNIFYLLPFYQVSALDFPIINPIYNKDIEESIEIYLIFLFCILLDIL